MFSNSIFTTVLKGLPRDQVNKIIGKHGTDRWRKSFTTWDHLVTMLGGQFSGVKSLRELEVLFDNHNSQHYHLGIKGVKRSTLSDANKSRSAAVFRDIAQMMIARSHSGTDKVHEVLSILDASHIGLMDYGYDWADKTSTRGHSRGLKLHVQMNYDSEMLEYAEVTSSNINDITAGLGFPLEAGRTYVFDKGYCDYNWWHAIGETGAHFVTRLKRNAAYKITHSHAIAKEDQGFVLQDQTIELTNRHPRAKKINTLAGVPLRLINIKHPSVKGRSFLIVSNNLEASAAQIAGWYKKRWSIELLFKWVKQNLKLKRFIGRSRNAVMIQIYVALIAYILLKLYKNMMGGMSKLRLKDIMTTLKTGLFTRPDMIKRRKKYREKTFQNQQNIWSLVQ